MAFVFKERNPPPEWVEFKARAPHRYLVPFFRLSWAADWAAYTLGKWPLVELLEYLGSFSILFAAIFYFVGASDRLKQKHYQAWQVINTAQGKGGNGGRIDALQELNADRVSLTGVDIAGAFLQGLQLRRANLVRAKMAAADVRGSDLEECDLQFADLQSANFRNGSFRFADLRDRKSTR